MKLFKSTKTQILILLTLTIVSYSSIFRNKFVLDDFDFIVNWQESHEFNLSSLLRGDQPQGHEGVYRPVRSLLYAIYFQIFGTNPFGYHLHSLLVHLASAILVYLITIRLIRHIGQIKKASLVPFLTALFFGLHPIHTESIAYIAASMEMTGVVFFLASFYFYLKSAQKKLSTLNSQLSILFAFLAFFTYEMTLTLPLVIILYEWVFSSRFTRTIYNYPSNEVRSLESSVGSQLRRLGAYFLGIFIYFLAKLSLTHNLHRGEYLGGSIYFTVLVMFKAFIKYLELLIWPWNLSLVHVLPGGISTLGGPDLKKEILAKLSFLDWGVLGGFITLITIIIIIIFIRKSKPLISFSLGWFLITLIPASQIIPLQVVMGEKYLYIPSIGFCLLLGVLFEALARTKSIYTSHYVRRIFTIFSFSSLIFLYFILTFTRNFNWFSSESIWKDATIKAPGAATAHYNLANIYQSENGLNEAKLEFEKALIVDPSYHPALSNLGFVYLSLGDLNQAETVFKKAIEIKDFYPMHYGLGVIYLKQGKKESAKTELKEALILNPNLLQAQQILDSLTNIGVPVK